MLNWLTGLFRWGSNSQSIKGRPREAAPKKDDVLVGRKVTKRTPTPEAHSTEPAKSSNVGVVNQVGDKPTKEIGITPLTEMTEMAAAEPNGTKTPPMDDTSGPPPTFNEGKDLLLQTGAEKKPKKIEVGQLWMSNDPRRQKPLLIVEVVTAKSVKPYAWVEVWGQPEENRRRVMLSSLKRTDGSKSKQYSYYGNVNDRS